MKKTIKIILSFINNFRAILCYKELLLKTTFLYRVKINIQSNNNVSLKYCEVSNTKINISGNLNTIEANNSLLENNIINISGTDNKLILEKGVKLRRATLHIRGQNCLVKIGNNTTTGGVRIVNVGNNNNIEIGEDCLLADNIEIWASDTHSIYNEKKEKINREKPITIGNRVWIGSHVIILKGVKIENDSVIGMGSTITKNIPKGVISVGTPNRTIKENITWDIKY